MRWKRENKSVPIVNCFVFWCDPVGCSIPPGTAFQGAGSEDWQVFSNLACWLRGIKGQRTRVTLKLLAIRTCPHSYSDYIRLSFTVNPFMCFPVEKQAVGCP